MVEVNTSLYSKNKSKLNIVLNVLIVVMAAALFAVIVFTSTYAGIYVVSHSMNNTLIGAETEKTAGGDYVYVNLRAKPDYGDIVVIDRGDGKTIIKRVIAFGGDRVKLIRGDLWIKYAGEDEFVFVEENYVSPENNTPSYNNFYVETGYLVEKDCLFLLGDNRNVSIDSRENNGTSFPIKNLFGVVTDWSLKYKEFFSAVHRYFYFDLPRSFGFKNS